MPTSVLLSQEASQAATVCSSHEKSSRAHVQRGPWIACLHFPLKFRTNRVTLITNFKTN